MSLRLRLALFWVFTAIVAIVLAGLFYQINQRGADSQVQSAKERTQSACSEIQRKFEWGIRNRSFRKEGESKFQEALLEIILDHYSGAEGGFWNASRSFIGYAFPTYEGSGEKTDVPSAEKRWLKTVAEHGLEGAVTDMKRGQREAVLVSACPIGGASERTSAWVMERIPIGSATAFDHFSIAVAILLFFVLFTGIGVTWLLYAWSRDLHQLEFSIKNYSLDEFPQLPASREPDLQTIVTALNDLNARFKVAHEKSKALTKKLAQADRLAVLGKLAAGVAHEIRNPMATARLKLENAAVAPAERLPNAKPIILEQMDRVDRLVQMLLAMTQPFELKAETINLKEWVKNAFPAIYAQAEESEIEIAMHVDDDSWSFDGFHLSRAIENLLQNALHHTPPGGRIEVTMAIQGSKLSLEIVDSGNGISAHMRDQLFEPFASGRQGGNGLGLLLVKEIVEAHGGSICEIGSDRGARFHLEIPWLKS